MKLDVDGPAPRDSGLFGLSDSAETARFVAIPVPFEATVSYRPGTARGPKAILAASHQVDLLDADVGRPYEAGIALAAPMEGIDGLNDVARAAAMRVIDAVTDGGAGDEADIGLVDDAGDAINRWLCARVKELLGQSKIPVVLGGDHAVPFGAIEACAAAMNGKPLGVLHLDAHCDLRVAYEGFRWSHASIMHNVIDRLDNVRLVQVGIRDFSESELDAVRTQPKRITTYFDAQLRTARLTGAFKALCAHIVSGLPDDVYLSFDIDGLDPTLCPHTGTPVPGGLSFDEVLALLFALVRAKRRIVGMDLVEVAPPPDVPDEDLGSTWDGNVAARLLYKMIGFALLSHGGDRPALPVPPGINQIDEIDG